MGNAKRGLGRPGGFTLMEVMVAVAIVGVLTAIVVPTYVAQMQKSRRNDAKNALLDLAAREERFYATNNSYTATASALGYSSSFPLAIQNGGTSNYVLNVSAASSTSFTATATRAGAQSNDACGDYQITDQGTQTNNNATLSTGCW